MLVFHLRASLTNHASAPPVCAQALIKTYEVHEEDAVWRCFFSVVRYEQMREQMCGLSITKLLDHPDPLMERDYPKIDTSQKSIITKQVRAGYLFSLPSCLNPPWSFGTCHRTSSITSAQVKRRRGEPGSLFLSTRR